MERSQHGKNIILNFNKIIYFFLFIFSKKDENTRREEIFSIIIDDLIKAFQSNLKDYVINLTTSRIISHITEKILTSKF